MQGPFCKLYSGNHFAAQRNVVFLATSPLSLSDILQIPTAKGMTDWKEVPWDSAILEFFQDLDLASPDLSSHLNPILLRSLKYTFLTRLACAKYLGMHHDSCWLRSLTFLIYPVSKKALEHLLHCSTHHVCWTERLGVRLLYLERASAWASFFSPLATLFWLSSVSICGISKL